MTELGDKEPWAQACLQADAQQVRLWKLIGGRVKRWLEPWVVGGWQVRVLSSARAQDLHSQLPDLLRKSNTTAIARGVVAMTHA
jgi:hypothetical protein